MEVAGILLAPIFEVLFDKLVSLAVSDYARREGIHHQMKKLEKMLPDIRAVLADAEEKQMKDDRVKSWMEDLTDLAYDLDDLLDDVATEALRLELLIMPEISQASSSSTSYSSKVKFLSHCPAQTKAFLVEGAFGPMNFGQIPYICFSFREELTKYVSSRLPFHDIKIFLRMGNSNNSSYLFNDSNPLAEDV